MRPVSGLVRDRVHYRRRPTERETQGTLPCRSFRGRPALRGTFQKCVRGGTPRATRWQVRGRAFLPSRHRDGDSGGFDRRRTGGQLRSASAFPQRSENRLLPLGRGFWKRSQNDSMGINASRISETFWIRTALTMSPLPGHEAGERVLSGIRISWPM